jgi:ABC-2 type transport system ATP-binding protein
LFSSFYKKHLDPDLLLEMVNLSQKKNDLVSKLSGGQKQRFSIVASLINDPEIVFLDEPTTGLDPLARRNLWTLIAKIKEQGKTIILTTHYMEEAEVLCDRVAIMEKGKIMVMDDTHKLINSAKNPFRIKFISTLAPADEKVLSNLGVLQIIANKKNNYELLLDKQDKVNTALGVLHKHTLESLSVSKASLEDIFIDLTGKAIAEEGENA